ncbi:MAG: Hsp20/alpha crystallin family protein, partial [Thermodesulfobacteriota bacterium]
TLSGVRKFNKDLSEEQYLRMERCYGSFQRAFTLPSAVNEKSIKAKFKDGILRITLPKTKGPRPKRIKVEGK